MNQKKEEKKTEKVWLKCIMIDHATYTASGEEGEEEEEDGDYED